MDSSGPRSRNEQDDEGDDDSEVDEPIVIPVRDRSKSVLSLNNLLRLLCVRYAQKH